MNEQLKANVTSSTLWVRLVYMLLFSFFLYLASFVVCAVIVLQFLFCLLTGADNLKLRRFGKGIARYVSDALSFLTFNSEYKPFPFADWPDVTEEHESFRVHPVTEPEAYEDVYENETPLYSAPVPEQTQKPEQKQTVSDGNAAGHAKPAENVPEDRGTPTVLGENALDEEPERPLPEGKPLPEQAPTPQEAGSDRDAAVTPDENEKK